MPTAITTASFLTATTLDPTREDVAASIAKWGDAASSTWLETRHALWKAPGHSADTPAVQGYLERGDWAFAWGDPVVFERDLRRRFEVVRGWLAFVAGQGKMPVYCCISESLQRKISAELEWSALTCIKEDVIHLDRLDLHNNDVQKNIRRSTRAGVSVVHLPGAPDGDVKAAVEDGLLAWEDRKHAALAAQALQPWIDAERRKYWLALKDDVPQALAVLAPIKDGGLQIKDAIAFPSSPKGVSEHLLATVLTDVRATGAAPTVSFGISADGELAPVAHLSGWKIKWLAKSYKTVLQTTGLTRRADFRHKFNVEQVPLYIAYPQGELGWEGVQALLKVLKHGGDSADDGANGIGPADDMLDVDGTG